MQRCQVIPGVEGGGGGDMLQHPPSPVWPYMQIDVGPAVV